MNNVTLVGLSLEHISLITFSHSKYSGIGPWNWKLPHLWMLMLHLAPGRGDVLLPISRGEWHVCVVGIVAFLIRSPVQSAPMAWWNDVQSQWFASNFSDKMMKIAILGWATIQKKNRQCANADCRQVFLAWSPGKPAFYMSIMQKIMLMFGHNKKALVAGRSIELTRWATLAKCTGKKHGVKDGVKHGTTKIKQVCVEVS